jgi:hypothetical protein
MNEWIKKIMSDILNDDLITRDVNVFVYKCIRCVVIGETGFEEFPGDSWKDGTCSSKM